MRVALSDSEALQNVVRSTEATLREMFSAPETFGSPLAVELQFLQAMEIKLLASGMPDPQRNMYRRVQMNWERFVSKEVGPNALPYAARLQGRKPGTPWEDADWETLVDAMRSYMERASSLV